MSTMAIDPQVFADVALYVIENRHRFVFPVPELNTTMQRKHSGVKPFFRYCQLLNVRSYDKAYRNHPKFNTDFRVPPVVEPSCILTAIEAYKALEVIYYNINYDNRVVDDIKNFLKRLAEWIIHQTDEYNNIPWG